MVDAIDLESIFIWSVGSSPTKDIYMLYNSSKNTISYCFFKNKKLFGLVLSLSKGWGIIDFNHYYFLIKNSEFYSFVLWKKSYSSFLMAFFLGFQKGYFKYLKLKGMGYKFLSVNHNLIIKIGFSHRVIYINSLNIYCGFINKYLLRFESRSLWSLKKLVQTFLNIRQKNSYKKKGIFLKGSLINIKINSKKSKF